MKGNDARGVQPVVTAAGVDFEVDAAGGEGQAASGDVGLNRSELDVAQAKLKTVLTLARDEVTFKKDRARCGRFADRCRKSKVGFSAQVGQVQRFDFQIEVIELDAVRRSSNHKIAEFKRGVDHFQTLDAQGGAFGRGRVGVAGGAFTSFGGGRRRREGFAGRGRIWQRQFPAVIVATQADLPAFDADPLELETTEQEFGIVRGEHDATGAENVGGRALWVTDAQLPEGDARHAELDFFGRTVGAERSHDAFAPMVFQTRQAGPDPGADQDAGEGDDDNGDQAKARSRHAGRAGAKPDGGGTRLGEQNDINSVKHSSPCAVLSSCASPLKAFGLRGRRVWAMLEMESGRGEKGLDEGWKRNPLCRSWPVRPACRQGA